jgi:tetratricopeptide (TPR) repeat protein/uncharacterized C2H2 Zn-finger protein
VLGVWGLGGAGKSQLVLKYLEDCNKDYVATFWIEAGQKQSLDRDLRLIYQLLSGVSAIVSEAIKSEDAVLAVKSWFQKRSGPYLLIFDSADTIDDENDPEYIRLDSYIPDARSVHVIITSRSSRVARFATLAPVTVDQMEETEALELFLQFAGQDIRQSENQTEAKLVVKELGYFALAVGLAGSYVRETHTDIRHYLQEYRRRCGDLLGAAATDLTSEYGKSVFATWESSFHMISKRSPEASRLLTLLSFLHFDDIYLGLFDPLPLQNEEGIHNDGQVKLKWRQVLSAKGTADIGTVIDGLRILQSFSLVQWKPDQKSYSIHKLVHTWGYERLDRKQQALCTSAITQLLAHAAANVEPLPMPRARLVPHLVANFRIVSKVYRWRELERETPFDLLDEVSHFLNTMGKYAEVFEIRKFIVDQRTRLCGIQNPRTLGAMQNLSVTLHDLGKLNDAMLMQRAVLERRIALREEHLDTMHHLAITLRSLGSLNESAAMLKEVSEKRAALGQEHPDTLDTARHLAITLKGLGKFQEAASILRSVLEKTTRILGEDHPDTISAMSELANVLYELGKWHETFSMHKEVLEKRKRILGEDHPDTILALGDLAATLGELGNYDKAVPMEEEVLEKRKRILGEDHPDSITALADLAVTLGNLRNYDKEVSMEEEVLEKRKRILGEDHPDTILALANLAYTLRKLGNYDKAVSMEEEVLEKRKRVLGEDHPDTIATQANLASTIRSLGKTDEAFLMKEVLEQQKRIPGHHHPDPIGGGAKENLAASGAGPAKVNEITTVRKSLSKFEHKNKLSNVHQDNDSLLECPECYKRFPLQKSLSQHMKATGHTATQSERPGESESDDDDSEYGSYLDEVDFHQEAISTEAEDTIFRCPGCTKQFPLQKSLSQHMTATGHTATQPESPGESESDNNDSEYGSYLDENDFHQEAISTEAEDTIFRCPGCTKQFPLRKSLSQHMKATGHTTD